MQSSTPKSMHSVCNMLRCIQMFAWVYVLKTNFKQHFSMESKCNLIDLKFKAKVSTGNLFVSMRCIVLDIRSSFYELQLGSKKAFLGKVIKNTIKQSKYNVFNGVLLFFKLIFQKRKNNDRLENFYLLCIRNS